MTTALETESLETELLAAHTTLRVGGPAAHWVVVETEAELISTVAALDAEQLARPIFYGWPRPATRSLLWVAAQALHEAEHHLDDVT